MITFAILDVMVDYDDFQRAHEAAIRSGGSLDSIMVAAEVDIDEALEHATVDQLREALSREDEGYTQGQLDAIRDCFSAVASGDASTAAALLQRIFAWPAQINAAEIGMAFPHRRAA